METRQKHVFLRLFSYMAPYKWLLAAALVFVLAVTGLELYRPILIGDAIDDYIEGYARPYEIVSEKTDLYFKGQYLQRGTGEKQAQLVLYEDQYYYFTDLSQKDSALLKDTPVDSYVLEDEELKIAGLSGVRLSSEELKVLRNDDFQGLINIGIMYAIVLFLNWGCTFGQTMILQYVGQNIIYNFRAKLFKHVHELPLRFFDTHPVGSIVTRITNDVEALNEMYANILARLVKNVVKIVGLVVVMLALNVRLALFSFIMMPVIAVLTVVFKTISRRIHRAIRTKITELNTFLSENISGMRLIQVFANEKMKFDAFKVKSDELYKANMRQISVFSIFRPLIYILSQLALAILIYVGAKDILAGVLSMGTLYVFINYISNLFEPIQDIAEQFSTLQNAFASAEKIFDLMDEENTITEAANPVVLQNPLGRIEFDHVWFAYENEDYVLKDVSFKIEPGQRVAFVGATGAGKSSILNLIGRYYDIQKGRITIEGVDIKDLDIHSLRQAIGQVQQDVFIFTGDIASNITLGNEISDEDLSYYAHQVNAAGFIEKLPHGYHEPVSERGSTLSAGQRQLLSFARTLAFRPNILVLDEATANIDTETEHLITDALEKMMKDRTTIMVAHRLSTIQHADCIYVMHKGRIRESGTHQELLAHDGIYKKLYELQRYTQDNA